MEASPSNSAPPRASLQASTASAKTATIDHAARILESVWSAFEGLLSGIKYPVKVHRLRTSSADMQPIVPMPPSLQPVYWLYKHRHSKPRLAVIFETVYNISYVAQPPHDVCSTQMPRILISEPIMVLLFSSRFRDKDSK